MKVFSLFKMTFLLIRVRYHFMYQDMVSSAVFSLAKWTFCQPQLNVLHTEIGCAWLCWCGCVQRVHVWVIGRGVEDSREKVQLGDNNNKYESESEWSEQCLKPKNFHNSVMGERMYPCERGNRSIARNESQGTPTWIGISIIIMIMSNK